MRSLITLSVFIAGLVTGLLFGGHVHPYWSTLLLGVWLALAAVFVGMVAPGALRIAERNAAIDARRNGDSLSYNAAYRVGYTAGRQAERTQAAQAERARWHVPTGEVAQ